MVAGLIMTKDFINAVPVILCGGSGSRLWPLSRSGFPKQFLCLTGDNSLFQQSIQRLTSLADEQISIQAPLIVTNEQHRFLALEQLREIGVDNANLILEPFGRNTAPALTLAALAALAADNDPVLVVTPADQTITETLGFQDAIGAAITAASQGEIIILGIEPTHPETGYGYIQVESNPFATKKVRRFVEKPRLDIAQSYLQAGDYFWNAGLFVLKASVWLSALEAFRADILQATKAAWIDHDSDGVFLRPTNALFAEVPAESVDYAVMEHCPGSQFPISMIPLNAGWSDLGAWDAVWQVLQKDEAGNSFQGDVLAHNTCNTLVHGSGRLVALVGVENLVVVETPDAILIADKDQCQDVKHIVNALHQTGREEHTLHRKVHRPWGWYDSIDEGKRFKVKHIQIKPKASLSLQKHYHRAEHWVVVKGTAQIQCGEQLITITENQSTYIPLGETHRLSNPGTIPLEIIEIQSGSYLGEDDIVRLLDIYGRQCE